MKFLCAFAVLLCCLQHAATAAAPAFAIEKTASGGVVVKHEGRLFAEYVVDQANKPYLAPVFGPTGIQMTRNYPMKNVEGEKQDHPHHRGICFGLEDAGGSDFWAEKATYEELNARKAGSGDARLAKIGRTQHREYRELKADRNQAVIVDVIDWISHDGRKVIEEERRMIFRATNGVRTIDFDQYLTASGGNVRLEDRKDSGLSIRVPTSMSVETKRGGRIVNSDGLTDADAWSKRAKWCDYHGPVENEHLGVAILNHPGSFRFPTPWHVRTYGLFTANAFASKGFDPKAEDAGFELKSGDRVTLRHRLVFHTGDEKSARIEEAWNAYAKEAK